MIKNIVVLMCVGFGLVVTVLAQQKEHFLDLTAVPSVAGMLVPPETGQVPIDERLGPGSVTIASHQQAPQSPFSMRVAVFGLNASTFATRDPLFYEVRLTNTGTRSIAFPWSVDQSLFRSTAHNSSVVFIGLNDARETRSPGETGLVILYGSTDVPGSVETVLPGESVRIRVRSEWMISTPGSRRIRAIVHLTHNGIGYPPIVSDNVLAIQVVGYQH
jgi:hypothetical protein